MYSQNNEEQFVLNYFGDFVGTFLDIGANDGITLSNTYALVQRGWKGTLIDASPKAYKRLLETYRGIMTTGIDLLNYAIGPADGEIVLSESGELLGVGDIALVSTTKYEETQRWKGLNMPFENVVVPMITFNSMVHMTPNKKYDFVSIDIEGMEQEVIPQIDFGALGTSMAIIEFNGKGESFFTDYMTPYGFKLIHKNAENLIYTL